MTSGRPLAVDELVDLGATGRRGSGRWRGQAARPAGSCNSTEPPVRRTGAAGGCSTRLGFVPCWWARLIVESTLTVQSMLPGRVGLGEQRAWIRSQVPSALNRWCRFHTVCHGPNAGRQVPPRDPGAEPVDRALDHLPMITETVATLSRPTTASTARSAPTEHRSAPLHATSPQQISPCRRLRTRPGASRTGRQGRLPGPVHDRRGAGPAGARPAQPTGSVELRSAEACCGMLLPAAPSAPPSAASSWSSWSIRACTGTWP